jgi:hypothetical protein
MRKSLVRIVGLLGFLGILGMSCGNPTAEEMASLAAKGYYEHLIHGEYEQFLQGKVGLNKHSEEEYWNQLRDNCHQFVHQQEQAHRGIYEVRVVNAKTDTLQKYTNVFMMLCFGDSTNEEIVVPMVERDGRWYMR